MNQYTILFLLATMAVLMAPSVQAVTEESTLGLDFTYEGTPFGGMIDKVIFCTCTYNYLLQIRDVASKSQKNILYTPGKSRLYAHFMISERRWILGTYSPAPPCEVRMGNQCVVQPTDGEINKGPGAGVSKLPTGEVLSPDSLTAF